MAKKGIPEGFKGGGKKATGKKGIPEGFAKGGQSGAKPGKVGKAFK